MDMKRLQVLWCLIAILATTTLFLGGFSDLMVSATDTPQHLPFGQNWTTTTLITANDDWSGVLGVVGFLGDYDAASPTNVDPRGLVTPFVTNNIDVIANQSIVNLTNGGVAEFDGIANPVVALNGSGTADAPHIVFHLITTGANFVCVSYNARDIDDTADNSVQQIETQYRVGIAGDWIHVPGGYIADASSGPSTTMTTPVSVRLPGAARDQAEVQVRIMTTNAGGNDEWIGIDDISATACTGPAPPAAVDYNGDGRTDYAVVRNISGQLRWFLNNNISGSPTVALDWGQIGDSILAGDYDGDGLSDIAVWRQAPGTNSAFYILRSGINTVLVVPFGVIGDDPSVVGDYDGDGKTDLAVYRPGATPGQQSTWFYRSSAAATSAITYIPWGVNGDKVAPGDYDGDGRSDFVVARTEGSGNYRYWMRFASTGAVSASEVWGVSGDFLAPGDYDGDGKTDLVAIRAAGGNGPFTWFVRASGGVAHQELVWGTSTSDQVTQGDYDGDGRTDIAIWRSTTGEFWSRNSSTGSARVFRLGSQNDFAVANFNRH